MTPEESSAITKFIASAPVIPLGEEVKECAILIRRLYGVKIPDAIIAATAQVLDATLVSNDRQLARVTSVRQIELPLRATTS
jgi:predicted nucleic acid-binding protein